MVDPVIGFSTGPNLPTATYGTSAGLANLSAVNAIPTNPLTSLGATAPSGWINSASIVGGALNAKGDWLTYNTYNTVAPSWWALPPSDYQQRGVAVTLPTTAPPGYGGTVDNAAVATAVWANTTRTITALPSIPNGWITSSGIITGALNGKGDWLTSTTYTSTQPGWYTAPANPTDYVRNNVSPTWYVTPPTDYQQRNVAVTLPITAPPGYGGTTDNAAIATAVWGNTTRTLTAFSFTVPVDPTSVVNALLAAPLSFRSVSQISSPTVADAYCSAYCAATPVSSPGPWK
jgi:hypothetical protein